MHTSTIPSTAAQIGFPSFGESSMATQTMSTREIARLTGKRHDHVMRDATTMLTDLYANCNTPNFGGIYCDSKNRRRAELHLPKRETLILVSGYSVAMRAAIIDRWQQLEAAAVVAPVDTHAILNDPASMRHLLLGYTERVIALESQVGELSVKSDALDRIAKADGSFCVTDAAKTLQVRRKDLFSFLRGNGWIYTRAGTSEEVAYQDKLAAGLLEHKITRFRYPDGVEKVYTQARVTPKGLSRLARELEAA